MTYWSLHISTNVTVVFWRFSNCTEGYTIFYMYKVLKKSLQLFQGHISLYSLGGIGFATWLGTVLYKYEKVRVKTQFCFCFCNPVRIGLRESHLKKLKKKIIFVFNTPAVLLCSGIHNKPRWNLEWSLFKIFFVATKLTFNSLTLSFGGK